VPWKEASVLEQRIQFILEWKERVHSVASLCRVFGISRQTGYKLIRRYMAAGRDVRALEDLSRRPWRSPHATRALVVEWVIAERKKHPHWGPRKLRVALARRHRGTKLPAASTIGDLLKRQGLVQPRLRRHRTPPYTQPFAACDAPNQVWCVDFKGHFRTGDGTKCYPLTITDAFSRYLIRCVALEDTATESAFEVFESAFKEFGLPSAIRSDNGVPFASRAAGGLSELSVWWVQLGIRPERIEPGKPQQNGRHERMHLTLKIETASPPAKSFQVQQRRFDRFRVIFNEERPHEALDYATPSSRYTPSPRSYPCELRLPAPDPGAHRVLTNWHGVAEFEGLRIPLGLLLARQYIDLAPVTEHTWLAKFGPVELGLWDETRKNPSLIRPRRRRGPGRRASTMSPG
jgi:transposase InsO family protein